MFTTLLVVATIGVAALLGAGVGHLAARPTINRLRAELAEAAWQLTHDPLTDLLNRTGLRAVHTSIATAGEPQPILVMLIDLDQFKEVNDTHGHDTGDDLLMEVADRLTELASVHYGQAARLSGDEFAVILPVRDLGISRLTDLFNTVIAAPVQVQTDSGLATITVTASVGITLVASTDPLEDIALHRADIAMYHAKHQGGDRHVLYTPGMTVPDRERRRGPRLRDVRRDQHGSVG